MQQQCCAQVALCRPQATDSMHCCCCPATAALSATLFLVPCKMPVICSPCCLQQATAGGAGYRQDEMEQVGKECEKGWPAAERRYSCVDKWCG